VISRPINTLRAAKKSSPSVEARKESRPQDRAVFAPRRALHDTISASGQRITPRVADAATGTSAGDQAEETVLQRRRNDAQRRRESRRAAF
jgi:hypothetical protein